MALQLPLEALEQSQRIGNAPREACQNPSVHHFAHLGCAGFDHRVIQRHLAVSAHCDQSVASHTQNGRASELAHVRSLYLFQSPMFAGAVGIARPWMRPPVHSLQPFDGRMRVHACGRETDVSEHLLDRNQIRSPVEKVRGEGMSERVRGQSSSPRATASSVLDTAR